MSQFYCTFCTGVIIAIYGHEREDGKFDVDDFGTADLPVQKPHPKLDEDRCEFVILFSVFI